LYELTELTIAWTMFTIVWTNLVSKHPNTRCKVHYGPAHNKMMNNLLPSNGKVIYIKWQYCSMFICSNYHMQQTEKCYKISCSRIPGDGGLSNIWRTAISLKHFLPTNGSWKQLCLNFWNKYDQRRYISSGYSWIFGILNYLCVWPKGF